MSCALPQRKAATHAASICQTHFKDVGEDHLGRTALLQRSYQIGSRLVRFPWIDVAFLLAPSRNAILVHNPIDPVLPHPQQHRQFAMPQGIIQFMPLLNRHRDLLIFAWPLAVQIQTSTRKREGTHYLALAIGAVGGQQLLGQFHLLCDG